jgi:hypothetical protein
VHSSEAGGNTYFQAKSGIFKTAVFNPFQTDADKALVFENPKTERLIWYKPFDPQNVKLNRNGSKVHALHIR